MNHEAAWEPVEITKERVSVGEWRRLEALKLALQYGHTLDTPETTVKSAAAFEAYLKEGK